MIKLTANEKTALRAWEGTYEDFDVLSFVKIKGRSGLEEYLVRRTVRAMARKGVTKFVTGCWSEDGYPMGSGYGLTKEGRELLETVVVE